MAKAEINVEFPCGYKYHMKFDVGMFGSFSADGEEFKTCPLHGKNCPPKSRTKKSSPIKRVKMEEENE